MDLLPIIPPTTAAGFTVLILAVALRHARLPLDHPNERSLHALPVPRSGGMAVIPAILLVWLLSTTLPWQIWMSCLLLFAVSAIDDLFGLRVATRLALHLAVAATVAVGLLGWRESVVLLAVVTVAIAWMINLYNFMDGSDGLAGGMTVIGFGAYGAAAWLGGDGALAIAAWTISGAAIGFLFYNFHPARVFLGDAGSVPLGFVPG